MLYVVKRMRFNTIAPVTTSTAISTNSLWISSLSTREVLWNGLIHLAAVWQMAAEMMSIFSILPTQQGMFIWRRFRNWRWVVVLNLDPWEPPEVRWKPFLHPTSMWHRRNLFFYVPKKKVRKKSAIWIEIRASSRHPIRRRRGNIFTEWMCRVCWLLGKQWRKINALLNVRS